MNKKKLTTVIAAMLLSLFGLIGVQLYWIDAALRLNDEQFGHRVNEALSEMVRSMEEKESERLLAMHFEKQQDADTQAGSINPATSPDTDNSDKSIHSPVARTTVPSSTYQNEYSEETDEESLDHSATEPTEFEEEEEDFPTRDAFRINKDNEDTIRSIPLLYNNEEHFIEDNAELLALALNAREAKRAATRNRLNAAALRRSQIRMQTFQKQKEMQNQKKELRRQDSSIKIIMSNKNKIIENVIVQLCNSGMEIEQDDSFADEPSSSTNNIRNIRLNKPDNMFRTIRYDNGGSSQSAVNSANDNRIVWKPSMQNRTVFSTSNTAKTTFVFNADAYTQKNALIFTTSSCDQNTSPTKAVTLTVAPKSISPSIVPIKQQSNTSVKKVTVRNVAQKVHQVTDMTARWIAELATGPRPIHQRLDSDSLENLIRTKIKNSGIELPFSYDVRHTQSGKIAFSHKALQSENNSNIYSATLFPNDILPSEYELRLYFHDNTSSAFEKIWKQLLASAIFLSIVVTSFGYTVVTMNRQKKISDMKTEFINNMTHEFQTPISTISLASEALKDPEIAADEARRQRFAGIIHSENKRLGKHVELLLQAAQIENGTYSIVPEPVDIHAIIVSESHNAHIQIDKRGGSLHTQLHAKASVLYGDSTHLSDIIRNLLDNAIKYSPDVPDITIETKNDSKYIYIAVKDKGRGMTREQASMVFERFYRVPTGNRHDVKGFGLGLSYVKAMVEAHEGTISVDSEPQKGSTFTLTLPLISRLSS